MNAMKKILAFALAGVMALALLTGCGTGSSAPTRALQKLWRIMPMAMSVRRPLPVPPLPSWMPSCKVWQRTPDLKPLSRRFIPTTEPLSRQFAPTSQVTSPSLVNPALSNKVVCLYCGKYDKDAGKQAINLNAHYAYINTSNTDLAGERQIGLITTSFTDTNGKKVKVRFAWWCRITPTRNTAQRLSPRSPGGFFCA